MTVSFETPQKNKGAPRAVNPDIAGMLLADEEANNLDRFVRARKPGERLPVAEDGKEKNSSRENSPV